MRGRFAWAGAAVILLVVGGMATVGTRIPGSTAMASSLMAWCRWGSIPAAAMMIAGPRTNRFVECVFTAPVRRCDWLAAKTSGAGDAGRRLLRRLAPMMLVYVWHVGMAPLPEGIPALDAGPSDRQPRHRHPDRRTFYRAAAWARAGRRPAWACCWPMRR